MSLQYLLITYGYAAVIVGTFLEGETILFLAGLAAHHGYLELPWVIIAAFAGSFSGDQLYFFIGRRHGVTVLLKRPGWQSSAERFNQLLERYHTPIILGFRFLYGLRSVAPFVIGMSSVPVRRFVPLNAFGAVTWAAIGGTTGFLLGDALDLVLGNIERYELWVLIALALLAFVAWLVRQFRRRPPAAGKPDSPDRRASP